MCHSRRNCYQQLRFICHSKAETRYAVGNLFAVPFRLIQCSFSLVRWSDSTVRFFADQLLIEHPASNAGPGVRHAKLLGSDWGDKYKSLKVRFGLLLQLNSTRLLQPSGLDKMALWLTNYINLKMEEFPVRRDWHQVQPFVEQTRDSKRSTLTNMMSSWLFGPYDNYVRNRY